MARNRTIDIRHPELTDEMGAKIAPHPPAPVASPDGGPRPAPNRPVVGGILRILRDGGRWKALPEGYPSPSTCWRRLPEWEEGGVWLTAWKTFLDELNAEGRIKWEECFADGSFAPAKRGATELARPRGARGPSGWWWSMAKASRWHPTSTRPARRRSSCWNAPSTIST